MGFQKAEQFIAFLEAVLIGLRLADELGDPDGWVEQ